jgi:predicted transcriptional regulator
MGKIKLLLYCTKSKYRLFYDYIDNKYRYGLDGKKDKFNAFNGKIVAECEFEVEKVWRTTKDSFGNAFKPKYDTWGIGQNQLLEESCLTYEELEKYLNENNGYAIHIKNLNIFDKPRELNECWANTNAWIFSNEKLYVAPQNMRYCGNWNLKKAILISIRPEWLCKILNHEKTIEVRRKVLKEMINNA